MRKISQFKRIYSQSKTLRFRVLPVGATDDNFKKKLLLQEDGNVRYNRQFKDV